MPAYFSITLEFSHDELDYNTMDKLKVYLDHAGLHFRESYNTDRSYTADEVRDHNQKLLEDNFELAEDQPYTEGYYQALYDFGGFSEVRGILLNNDPVEGEYSYKIIIPEDEVVGYASGGYRAIPEKAELIKELIRKMWLFPEIRTIQTGLERTESITTEADIRSGKLPSACPFAIISERHFNCIDAGSFNTETVDYGGVLLTLKSETF